MERTFSIPVPDDYEARVARQKEAQPLDTLPQAIADYIREHLTFSAGQLQNHLAERYLITPDREEFANELPQLLDAVAQWQASLGTPIEFTILDSKEEPYTISGGRTLVHAYGDTFAVEDIGSPAYLASITMEASANPALAPLPESESLPGHEIDPAFSEQELKIAETAQKRLSWYTSRGGVHVANLEKWLVEPGFSKYSVVLLIERLLRRGLLVAVDTETETPLVTLPAEMTADMYLHMLKSPVQIEQGDDEV